ncbi:hypothetical protein RHMOL_Rhmol05G0248000 [Rhododendron molle]|uniref:Uncharacterized protein n=1 Tax=Rhododendron molle TaxID=49168 RepID=A0ACC0NSY3_RHOML|nr:hypothetical protein RHMOL_Rhmol05G0248000 [Rhododendron molle]
MKIITKQPTSSPSRTEKPPPPLMIKFLRTNTVARSRGRSRSSPMFIRKRNSSSIETQSEPSSPKVTCIGQVRSSGSNSGRRTESPACFPCSCPWVNRNALFCTRFAKRLRPSWGKCQWFSPFGYCRSSRKTKAGSPKIESNQNDKYEGHEDEEEEEDEDEFRVGLPIEGFDCYSPPRNALLLTRCRSAPYKPSSLASKFWGQETGENRGGEGPTLEREPSCGDSSLDLRMDRAIEGNLVGLGEIEESMIDGGIKKMETGEGGGGGIGRGWVLARCKSEQREVGRDSIVCD